MEEIWREIKGYEGLYQVSNLGKVKSLNWYHSHKEHLMKLVLHKPTGYLYVGLFKKNTFKRFRVQRLVAQAFPEICGEWFNGCEVGHHDCNRSNNEVTNLYVCTHKENMGNEITNYNQINSVNSGKYKARHVICLSLDNVVITEYKSVCEASRATNTCPSNISACCLGKRDKANNFKWKYKESV